MDTVPMVMYWGTSAIATLPEKKPLNLWLQQVSC